MFLADFCAWNWEQACSNRDGPNSRAGESPEFVLGLSSINFYKCGGVGPSAKDDLRVKLSGLASVSGMRILRVGRITKV